MWLGSGVVLLIITIVVIVHHTECRDRSGTDLSYARYSQSKTTRRTHHIRTTTHRPRSTRRTYPITTTPRPHRVTTHRTTTRRPTTRRHIITTTPSWTTKRTTTGRHHITTRPPPYNPYWTTTQKHNPIGHGNWSHTSRQPPYNPFFSSSTRPSTTRQPPFNPFFTSSTRPPLITTQHIRPLGNGLGNGSHTTRQPPYNPFFSTSTRPPLITTHSRPVGNGVGNESHTTRQPPYNPFFSSSTRPTFMTTQHVRPVGNGIGNMSFTTRQPPYNPIFSTTPRPHWPSGNSTGNGKHRNETNAQYIATTKRSTTRRTTPVYIWNLKTNASSVGSGKPPSPGFVIPRRNQSSVYHPPGNAFNHSAIHQRPTYNTSQGINSYPGYPVYHPAPPVPNTHGIYHPGAGYNTGTHPQQQQPPHITIINNNINNQNHHVIYPSQHWSSYGPPASGVTIINNNNNNHGYYHPPPTYRYSTTDTGSSTLGFYLGYRLGQLSRPSYHYHGTYYENDRYVPRYDHYVVHHYYHQRDSIPKEAEIPNNIIVTCDGDSGSICPPNTVPLCTNNAAVMCVANGFSTTPCENDKDLNCVRSSVPCVNSNTKECQGKSNVAVSVPCISTARIEGIPTIVNNTLFIDKSAVNETRYPLCVTVLALPTAKNETSEKKDEQIRESFHYTTNDTGIDTLGIYLGQTLEELEYPSYVYLNYDSNMKYTDRFDHYNVYHYYHGGSVLPNDTEIYPNSTISCAGDSGTICPQNSSSVCFSDGGVACLTDVSSTIYNSETKTRLVLTTIACKGSKDPACKDNNSSIPLIMPCMSISKIYANTSYLINSVKSVNGTMRYYKTINIIHDAQSNGTNITNSRLLTPREFCVTILLLPGEKVVKFVPKSRRVTGIKNAKEYLSLPKYSYSSKLASDKTIGYYIAHRLDKMRYPSFYFLNEIIQAQDGSIQLYDHLSVHHYYDGREVIPDSMNLQSSSMVVCPGDSGTACPTNTSAICLNDGSIMCVTDLLRTESCSKERYCARSTLSCKNLEAPKCRKAKNVYVTLPCISVLTVYGDIVSVDNRVYKFDMRQPLSYVGLQPRANTNTNVTQGSDKMQLFCVSIVLLPEVRPVTEGEKVINATNSIFAKFAMKVFGIS